MNIAFLTTANSWHVPVRTKYLVSKGHNVHLFNIHPGSEQEIIPPSVKVIDIKSAA